MDAIQNLEITRTTYRVADFLSWQRAGNLDLRPHFQRNSVWSQKAKSFFLDSIVRGFPVPLLFVQDQTDSKTYEPKRLVVDGQQRLRTVLAFVDVKCLVDREHSDSFTVLKMHNTDIAGRAFGQLPLEVRNRILNFQFSTHVLPSTTPNARLLEIFARMNATGTKLNEQELRNAAFSGAFKQVAYATAYANLERWIQWGIFSESQVAKMGEVELVSDLFIFLTRGMQAKSQKTIDGEYSRFDDAYPVERVVRKRFRSVMETLAPVYEHFETDGDPIAKLRSQSWFYVVFAACHDLLFGDYVTSRSARTTPRSIDPIALARHLTKRSAALESGSGVPDDLVRALRGASTDRSSRVARYDFIKKGWRDA